MSFPPSSIPIDFKPTKSKPSRVATSPLGRYAKSASRCATLQKTGQKGAYSNKSNKSNPKNKFNPKPKPEKLSPDELNAALITERFNLQAGARHLLPGERVAGCLRRRQGGKDCVEVWHLPEVQRARFGNLQTCASVWMCPVCAAKITERRKLELVAALRAATEQGMVVIMVTYTLRHNAGDRLQWLLEGLTTARRKATGGRAAKTLREDCGVVGSVRSLELTWGEESGWHPHVHELLFLRSEERLGHLMQGLRSQWDDGLRLAGMREVNEHGCDIKIADADIAAYVEKFGRERSWDVEHELTKQPVKKGREGRFTPTELLRSFVHDGDLGAGDLWREYARTMKGSRQLYWSRGLRALLLPAAPELTDQEVAEEIEQSGTLLARLDLAQWKTVLFNDARAQVLIIAGRGDRLALFAYLSGLKPAPLEVKRGERATRMQRREVRRGCLDDEEEAQRLGLNYVQYRLWKRQGITAIADTPQRAGTQAVGASGAGRVVRKEVKPCEEKDRNLTFTV